MSLQWSGITGITFFTEQHVLCITTRSIQTYTLDFCDELRFARSGTRLAPEGQPSASLHDLGLREALVHKQGIPNVTMRGVSFSRPSRAAADEVTDVCTSSFLTYDVLRGLFHFRVQMTSPRAAAAAATGLASVPLDVSCTLLAAHHMAQLIPTAEIVKGDGATPRSGFTAGSRGFVSACALGARGQRGIWIERERTNMGRFVYGFAAADHDRSSSAPAAAPEPRTAEAEDGREASRSAEIDGRCLYEVRNSYDLRGADVSHH